MFFFLYFSRLHVEYFVKVVNDGLVVYLQVVVQQVHIDGLGRTKEDLLTYEIAEVFRAKNLIDVSTC